LKLGEFRVDVGGLGLEDRALGRSLSVLRFFNEKSSGIGYQKNINKAELSTRKHRPEPIDSQVILLVLLVFLQEQGHKALLNVLSVRLQDLLLFI
jgi:hypothetical protein